MALYFRALLVKPGSAERHRPSFDKGGATDHPDRCVGDIRASTPYGPYSHGFTETRLFLKVSWIGPSLSKEKGKTLTS